MPNNNTERYLKLRAKFYKFEPMTDAEIIEYGLLSEKLGKAEDGKKQRYKKRWYNA